MNSQNKALVASEICVKVGSTIILDKISFRLFPGELCGLIGPSGAGKSTLMKVLLGLTSVTSGSVYMERQPVGISGGVGYVPQIDALHMHLTVQQALDFAASLWLPEHSEEHRNKRVSTAVKQVGLQERLDLRIGSLSGGQKKRVSVALELLTQPKLLILDEPTSGLDPGLEAKMMSLFEQLSQKQRILMVATHAMQSLNLCSVLMILMRGHLIYIGAPSNALKWFEVEHFSGIFERLPKRKAEDWALRFSSSELCRAFAQRSSTASGLSPKELSLEPNGEQSSVFDARAKLAELKKARVKKP